jgi:serine/threonine protein kinase
MQELLRRRNMISENVQYCDLHDGELTITSGYRHRSYKLRSNHAKCEDETEVTADETVGDCNESSSSFSLSSSFHFPSTSYHSRWHGSSNLFGLQEHSEQLNDSSFSYEALDESLARDINDWNVLRILGEGAFGQVAQVKSKSNNEQSVRCYALKMLSKYQILCNGQIEDVIMEKSLLKEASAHPFIVKLRASWQDANLVYMLQDFVQGGELYSVMLHTDHDHFSVDSDRLPMRRALPESQVQFYTACIADALHYLHQTCRIVYRDLKPENVLIDSNGYPVIIDLGLAKRLEQQNDYQTRTLCGTPRYVAPEQIQGLMYSFEVDYWALGVLVYEMMTGLHPFDDWDGCNDIELYNSVTYDDYRSFCSEDESISEVAKDFIDGLLTKDPSHRLGHSDQSSPHLPSNVQAHKWISSIDVNELRERDVQAPWVPTLRNAEDAGMFDDWSLSSHPTESLLNQRNFTSLTAKEQERFNAFDYV